MDFLLHLYHLVHGCWYGATTMQTGALQLIASEYLQKYALVISN